MSLLLQLQKMSIERPPKPLSVTTEGMQLLIEDLEQFRSTLPVVVDIIQEKARNNKYTWPNWSGTLSLVCDACPFTSIIKSAQEGRYKTS